MNFCRRILMAPGSLHHWKKVVSAPPPSTGVQNYRIWKVACSSPAAAPFSAGVETSEVTPPPIKADLCDDASSSAEKAKMLKRDTFHKMRRLTVETIDLIIREEEKKGVYVNQEDLFRWAKLLTYKYRKPENALEIFRWMDSKKMIFGPYELQLYVHLVCQLISTEAARELFNRGDPNFDRSDPKAKNQPAYKMISYWYRVNFKNSLLRKAEFTKEDLLHMVRCQTRR